MRDGTTRDLGRAVKTGVVWVLAERGALQILNLAASVVLARLLSPGDFGTIGISFLVTGLATRLLYVGFGMALVQREALRPDHVSTLFVVSLAVNGGLCLATLSVAPYVGAYFGSELAGDVLRVMSLTFVIRAFAVCPTALLRRRLDFRSRTVGSVLDASVKLSVAVLLALLDFGVWSLVYGELSGAVVEKAYLIAVSGWRPSLVVTRAAFSDLFGYGLGISLKSTVIYLSDRIDNFVVGKSLGTVALGLYERAYRLMDLPVRELSARMNAVLFPAFARLQDNPARLGAAYRKTVLSMAVLCYPLFGSLIVLAPQVVPLVYGPQWTGAVLPFQILCLAGIPRVLAQISGSAINATGAVGQEVWRRAAAALLLFVGALVGSRWGLAGVAAAVAGANVVTLLLVLLLVRRACSVSMRQVFGSQVRPLVAALALVGAQLLAGHVVVHTWGASGVWVVPTGLVAGAGVYAGLLYLARDEELERLFEELRMDARALLARAPFRSGGRAPELAEGAPTGGRR